MMSSEDCSLISDTKDCMVGAMDSECLEPKKLLNKIFKNSWDDSKCASSTKPVLYMGCLIFLVLLFTLCFGLYCNKKGAKKGSTTSTK